MARLHQHGSKAFFRFKDVNGSWFDLGPHATGGDLNPTSDTVEDTTMDPEGRAKTYLLGLIGRTVNHPVIIPNTTVDDDDLVLVIDAITRAGLPVDYEFYPFGQVDQAIFAAGSALFTTPCSIATAVNAAVTGTVGIQLTGDVTWDRYSA